MVEKTSDYFLNNDNAHPFYQVIALHKEPDLSWEAISEKIPTLPRGWYELSRLSGEDRIEFTYDYWLSQLPYLVNANHEKRLSEFFGDLEEVGIYATQVRKNGPFDVHMIYDLKEEMGFFQGGPPASEASIERLIQRFAPFNLPPDYLAFLKIHDGFSKYTDTGMIKLKDMTQVYQRLQHMLSDDVLRGMHGESIDPQALIPFYESFGLHCYQCFFAEWYPQDEMGNVYFSEHDRTISNYQDKDTLEENLAFSSFLAWLIFYLEDIYNI